MSGASDHGIPMSQAIGAKSQPKTSSKLKEGASPALRKPVGTKAPPHAAKFAHSPTSLQPAFTSATKAMKAISMAATLKASARPSAAPREMASSTLRSTRVSSSTLTWPLVTGFSSSGTMSFAMSREPGADMTLTVMRWPAMSGRRPLRRPT